MTEPDWVGATPRDAESISTELHSALHRADIGGPYVLAGHSFGGLVVRAFADRYPTETAGLPARQAAELRARTSAANDVSHRGHADEGVGTDPASLA